MEVKILVAVIVAVTGFNNAFAGSDSGSGSGCNCQSIMGQLAAVQSSLDSVGNRLQQCPCSGIASRPSNFDLVLCQGMTRNDDLDVLDATGPGSWPSAGLCRVVFPATDPVYDGYSATILLKGIETRSRSRLVSHPGVAFNVINKDNFDFVYFRPHYGTGFGCLQHGYVQGGRFQGTTQATCPTAVVDSTWFEARVESRPNGQATVFINGVSVNTVNSFFPSRSRVGVIVANGYKTLVHYKDIVVLPL